MKKQIFKGGILIFGLGSPPLNAPLKKKQFLNTSDNSYGIAMSVPKPQEPLLISCFPGELQLSILCEVGHSLNRELNSSGAEGFPDFFFTPGDSSRLERANIIHRQ